MRDHNGNQLYCRCGSNAEHEADGKHLCPECYGYCPVVVEQEEDGPGVTVQAHDTWTTIRSDQALHLGARMILGGRRPEDAWSDALMQMDRAPWATVEAARDVMRDLVVVFTGHPVATALAQKLKEMDDEAEREQEREHADETSDYEGVCDVRF